MTDGILREVSLDPFNYSPKSVNYGHCPNCDAWLIDPDLPSDFVVCPSCSRLYTPDMREAPDEDGVLEEVPIYT